MEKKDKREGESKSTMMETTIKVPVILQKEMDKITGTYLIKPAKDTWLGLRDRNHDGAVLFSNTFISLCPDVKGGTGLIATGLTEPLARELEEAMELKKGSLSPYNKEYWSDYRNYLRIPKEGIIIDCDRSAKEKVFYCYAKASAKVALSYTDLLDKPEAEFVMISEVKEAEITNKKWEKKSKAFKRYGEMSLTEQMDFLKVFEEGRYKVNKTASPDFIASAVGRIVDEQPEKFLEFVDNPYFKTMIFLQDCIAIKAITKSGTKYFVNGGDQIGSGFMNTIQNLQSPEYQDAVISLRAKLDAINK